MSARGPGGLGAVAASLVLSTLASAQGALGPTADDAESASPPASWSSSGPWTSRRGEWTWELRGVLSVHARRYDDDNAKTNGLETKLLAPIVEARHDDGVRLVVEGDLDGEETHGHLWEAWAEVPLGEGERHWLRAGRQRVPLGTELATRREDHAFVGYAFPAYQAGRWDTGLRVDGHPGDQLWYELFATTGHGFDLEGRRRQDPYDGARLMVTPPADEPGDFEGLFGGLTYGMNPDYDDHIQVSTPFDNTVFTTGDLDGSSATWEHLELGWRCDAFRFGYEQTDGEVEGVPLPGGGKRDFEQLTTFSVYTVFNLRGEAARWERGRWVPVLSDAEDAELPVELAFRYSNADIDRDLFDVGLASFDPSTQEVRTFSAAVSGYLDPLTRLSLQWVHVIADHELTTFGGTNRDSSLVLRFDRWFGRNPNLRSASDGRAGGIH